MTLHLRLRDTRRVAAPGARPRAHGSRGRVNPLTQRRLYSTRCGLVAHASASSQLTRLGGPCRRLELRALLAAPAVYLDWSLDSGRMRVTGAARYGPHLA